MESQVQRILNWLCRVLSVILSLPHWDVKDDDALLFRVASESWFVLWIIFLWFFVVAWVTCPMLVGMRLSSSTSRLCHVQGVSCLWDFCWFLSISLWSVMVVDLHFISVSGIKLLLNTIKIGNWNSSQKKCKCVARMGIEFQGHNWTSRAPEEKLQPPHS